MALPNFIGASTSNAVLADALDNVIAQLRKHFANGLSSLQWDALEEAEQRIRENGDDEEEEEPDLD